MVYFIFITKHMTASGQHTSGFLKQEVVVCMCLTVCLPVCMCMYLFLSMCVFVSVCLCAYACIHAFNPIVPQDQWIYVCTYVGMCSDVPAFPYTKVRNRFKFLSLFTSNEPQKLLIMFKPSVAGWLPCTCSTTVVSPST